MHDVFELQNTIRRQKYKAILKKIEGYKDIRGKIHNQEFDRAVLLQQVEKFLDGELEPEELVKMLPFNYPDNKKFTLEFLQRIDSAVFLICYPLFRKKTHKEESLKPLFTFICRCKDEQVVVDEFGLNKEGLELIVAAIAGCSTDEIERLEQTNLEELMNANDHTQQTDLFEILRVFDQELRARYGGSGLDTFGTHEGRQRLHQFFVTFDELGDVRDPIFRNEMKRILELSGGAVPPLLDKYLNGNPQPRIFDDAEQRSVFYDGSYTGVYLVNEKQWSIVGQANWSELLAVNGPLGTGKTTLLKELIADYLVKKVKVLVDDWETPCQTLLGTL